MKSLQWEEKKRFPGGVGPPGKGDNGRKVKKLESVGKRAKVTKKSLKREEKIRFPGGLGCGPLFLGRGMWTPW